MKKKMVVITFCLAIVLFIGMLICYIHLKNNKKTTEITGIEKLDKKLKNKDDMLIYVTDKKCDLCKPIDKMIKYYENAYNFDFYYANQENISRGELKEYYDLPDGAIEFPAVIFIRDGVIKGIDNRIMSEDYFRDYLIEYGFLDKSYYENDYRITYEEFKMNLESPQKKVLFFYNYGSNVYVAGESTEKKEFANAEKLRGELLKLSKNNNFTYRVIFSSSIESDKIFEDVVTLLEGKIVEGPFVVITEKGKVLDYLIPKKVSTVASFLKKNGIIKSN